MRRMIAFLTYLTILLTALWLEMSLAARPRAQSQGQPAAQGQKTAEQQFKNIQVLKNIPAEQLIPTMQFISASLNVECTFCHVEHQMDKDDKKEKRTARKMMTMQLAIDKDNFDGQLTVTCFTCHRGAAHPVGIPILLSDAERPAPHVHGENQPNLPKADEILDKYLAAMGGADALKKFNTRVQKGTLDAMGHNVPITIYSEAPDKRVSISQQPSGPSVTGYNGEVGWLTIPNGVHRMSAVESAGAQIDAQFYLPIVLREIYKEFRVRPGDPINSHATYMVSATGGDGHPALALYFDQQAGLLLRLIRYTETALGRLPTQVDYADYRETSGVKTPYQWTLVRPNGSFTIRVTQVQQNVKIDPKIFVAPSETPPPGEGPKK
jgi:photosynthetic reaction center cytochrome c subunit